MNEFVEKLIDRIGKLQRYYFYGVKDLVRAGEVEKAAKQLTEEYKGGWIPCSERLPDKEGMYLITLKRFKIITLAAFKDIKNNPHFNADVIAWMPMPEPYKESE